MCRDWPRRVLTTIVGVGLLFGLSYSGTFRDRAAEPAPLLQPDVAYRVTTTSNRASLTLPRSDGHRDLLIISSLGDPGSRYHVVLRSTTDLSAPLSPLVPFELSVPVLQPPSSFASIASPRNLPSGASERAVRNAPPAEREFWIHVTDGPLEHAHSYARVMGTLVGQGNDVAVYLDRMLAETDLAPGLVAEIVSLLEDELLPRLRSDLGEVRDVDEDGYFTVLLSPWLSHLQGGRTTLQGFVRSTDFRTDVAAPFSNRCDMLYLNTSLAPGAGLKTLLAHELTHAIAFSCRVPPSRHHAGLPDEDDWLNEGIAHVVERTYGGAWTNLDYRISRYLNEPGRYPLAVADYYRSGLWRNHGCRGATFLFLQWCVERSGPAILPALLSGDAAGRSNLEQATGRAFADLYRAWSIDLLRGADAPVPRLQTAARMPDRTQGQPVESLLPLYGRCGSFALVGPATTSWNPEKEPIKEVSLRGTATAYIELTSRAEPRQIRINAPPGTELQVTVIRRPESESSLMMTAAWRGEPYEPSIAPETTAPAAPAPEQLRRLRIQLPEADQKACGLTVDWIACEQHDGEFRRSRIFDAAALSRLSPPPASSSPGGIAYEVPLPPETDASRGLPWIVKVAARDSQGRRRTGFIRVEPEKAEVSPLSPAAPDRLAVNELEP